MVLTLFPLGSSDIIFAPLTFFVKTSKIDVTFQVFRHQNSINGRADRWWWPCRLTWKKNKNRTKNLFVKRSKNQSVQQIIFVIFSHRIHVLQTFTKNCHNKQRIMYKLNISKYTIPMNPSCELSHDWLFGGLRWKRSRRETYVYSIGFFVSKMRSHPKKAVGNRVTA